MQVFSYLYLLPLLYLSPLSCVLSCLIVVFVMTRFVFVFAGTIGDPKTLDPSAYLSHPNLVLESTTPSASGRQPLSCLTLSCICLDLCCIFFVFILFILSFHFVFFVVLILVLVLVLVLGLCLGLHLVLSSKASVAVSIDGLVQMLPTTGSPSCTRRVPATRGLRGGRQTERMVGLYCY
jgi:hypothetical protein